MTPQRLRFSATLQFVAAAFFGMAFAVRTAAFGIDALALVFAFVGVLALVAGIIIRRRAKELESETP